MSGFVNSKIINYKKLNNKPIISVKELKSDNRSDLQKYYYYKQDLINTKLDYTSKYKLENNVVLNNKSFEFNYHNNSFKLSDFASPILNIMNKTTSRRAGFIGRIQSSHIINSSSPIIYWDTLFLYIDRTGERLVYYVQCDEQYEDQVRELSGYAPNRWLGYKIERTRLGDYSDELYISSLISNTKINDLIGFNWDLDPDQLAIYYKNSDNKMVKITGSYSDLSDKPVIEADLTNTPYNGWSTNSFYKHIGKTSYIGNSINLNDTITRLYFNTDISKVDFSTIDTVYTKNDWLSNASNSSVKYLPLFGSLSVSDISSQLENIMVTTCYVEKFSASSNFADVVLTYDNYAICTASFDSGSSDLTMTYQYLDTEIASALGVKAGWLNSYTNIMENFTLGSTQYQPGKINYIYQDSSKWKDLIAKENKFIVKDHIYYYDGSNFIEIASNTLLEDETNATVKYDRFQYLTTKQKEKFRENIGALGKSDIITATKVKNTLTITGQSDTGTENSVVFDGSAAKEIAINEDDFNFTNTNNVNEISLADKALYVKTDSNQDITGVKTFKAAPKTNILENENGNAVYHFNGSQIYFGQVSFPLVLRGNSTRPNYTTDGTNSVELALLSDINTLKTQIEALQAEIEALKSST